MLRGRCEMDGNAHSKVGGDARGCGECGLVF